MGPHCLPVPALCIALSITAPRAGGETGSSGSQSCLAALIHSFFSDEETDFISNDVRKNTHVPFQGHVDERGEGLF